MVTTTTVLVVFFALLLLGVPIAYVVLGAAAVGILGNGYSPALLAQQTFAGANSFVMLSVPFFIISGDIASKGKTASKIVDVINAFFGRVPGGLGIATIAACAFFGAITGSAIATIVAIGALMLPKLIEAGYPKLLALGIITCGGTLGVMIPPSIPMLLVSVALQTSVSASFAAGFIPGILTAALMCLWIFFYAKKNKIGGGEKLSFKEKMTTVKNSIWALLYPVIVLGSIYSGIATPTEAAVISVFYVLIVEVFVYRKFSFQEIYATLRTSTVNAATMTIFVATAQVLLYYVTKEKIPDRVITLLTANVNSAGAMMAILCFIFLVAGCFTNVGAFVVILSPILLAILSQYDISVTNFVIVCTLMNQIGFITPPFGLCLFVTMKIAGASVIEVVRGSIPFLIAMAVATVLVIMFPGIALFLPRLLGFTV